VGGRASIVEYQQLMGIGADPLEEVTDDGHAHDCPYKNKEEKVRPVRARAVQDFNCNY
jgi:hypothetical protein